MPMMFDQMEDSEPRSDNDFILTISDNDEDFSTINEESNTKRSVLKKTISTNDRSQKASKNGSKTKANGKRESQVSVDLEDDNDSDQPMEEDDGAINPEFEFQVADHDQNIVEGFDAWGEEGFETQNGNASLRKKGVDLEALIARRRKKNDEHTKIANLVDGEEDAALEEPSLEESEMGFDSGEDEEDSDIGGFGDGAEDEEDHDLDYDKEAADAMSASGSEAEAVGDEMPQLDSDDEHDNHSSGSSDVHDLEEQSKRDAFFAPKSKENNEQSTASAGTAVSFQAFSLSRPILRGLSSMSFTNPTPIQRKTIPVALMGKDVVGGAVTGSGKTAAFIVPILERLLYRPKKIATSRVVVLTPTRELAVQCFTVAKKLASFTDITFCQLVGGFSLREQEAVLRSRPDVIIATPGRFIDHMRNSASFTIDTLEILVLDEADRMLEDGFADELNEILTTIPRNRQTMLFSATMTDTVDKLIRVGLQRPVRLMVDSRKQTVGTLTQEFVRLRPGREEMRLAYLVHLCTEVYTDRVIVFFRQKKEAHRVRVVFGLLGINAAELHGSMSQEQRIAAMTSFTQSTTTPKDSNTPKSTHLLATDLASRGLDIPAVGTVINYTAPQSHEIYLHRVGRTARAGRVGRACTLAAEPDRKVVKAAVKTGRSQGAKIVSRTIDADIIDALWARINSDEFNAEVDAILREEKEEKVMGESEMLVQRGENLMQYADEIKARPKRTWFETEKEKLESKKRGMVELNGDVGLRAQGSGGKAGKSGRGKLSGKEKKALDDRRERVEGGRMWKKGKNDAKEVSRRDKGGKSNGSKDRKGPNPKSVKKAGESNSRKSQSSRIKAGRVTKGKR